MSFIQHDLRIPPKHKGPLLITYYIIHKNCGLRLLAKVPREKTPVSITVDSNDSGKSKVLLEIPEPIPGNFYTFKILAKAEGEFTLGVSAIKISKR